MVLLREFMDESTEKRITLCPPKVASPVRTKIAQTLQNVADLCYKPDATDEEIIERLGYLEGFITGIKEVLKK